MSLQPVCLQTVFCQLFRTLTVTRLKSIMLQNLPIMLSGISFFLPIIPKIMLTAPIILQIMLIYLQNIILYNNNKFMHVNLILEMKTLDWLFSE